MSEQSLEWLRLVGGNSAPLVHHDWRLSQIQEQLRKPATKYPSVVMFLGRERKDAALHLLFPQNRSSVGYGIRLQADNWTLYSHHPILVADCDPHLTPMQSETSRHFREEIAIRWATGGDLHVLDVFLARLFFPFVDVICMFADDMGGMQAVRTTLTTWATLGAGASSLKCRPRVLVVAETEEVSILHDMLEEDDFLSGLLHNQEVRATFAEDPRLLHLPSQPPPCSARFRPLKEEILRALDLARQERRELGCLFSAAHLDGFFDRALRSVCKSRDRTFDFAQAARGDLAVGHIYTSHLVTFLDLTDDQPLDSRMAFIASTILMDAYPTGVHRKMDP
jgi:hypothetical protein